jgi:NADH dehydrogenase FAD-containing subunit
MIWFARMEIEGRKYYSDLLKYVRISLVEAGNAILQVFDEALRNEALKMLTERQTRLIEEGLIQREITSVILKSGVK